MTTHGYLPKISIVTPSYNQGDFIEQTINSVLQQKYDNIEYVIVDGGSTDSSVDIIKKYEKRLHFWVSEKDNGHGDALNKGFSRTTGEIMAWINSDDKYTPWSFNVVAEIFSIFPHVMWIVGYNSLWNKSGAMVKAFRRQKNIFDFLLGNYAWIQQESVFWRRSLWERAGGYINQDYKFMIDGELWTRFFLHEELYSVDCILGGYRMHGNNRAKNNYLKCLEEMEKAISTMKEKCNPEVIDIYNKLRFIKKINENPVLKFSPISSLYAKINGIEEKIKYKNIKYKNEKWIERIIPFTIY